jgi:hypothetical protein
MEMDNLQALRGTEEKICAQYEIPTYASETIKNMHLDE